MSGGYAGAKRMLWIMAKYANGISAEKSLGIHFQAIVPLQIIGGTGVGDAGANAYAHAMGMKPEQYLARFGAPAAAAGVRRESCFAARRPEICRGCRLRSQG